jgi:hypothetical protein
VLSNEVLIHILEGSAPNLKASDHSIAFLELAYTGSNSFDGPSNVTPDCRGE